jgi:hypothetical protein
MTVTVQIETNTEAGQKLITELRRYPEIVRFVEPDQIAEPIPEGYVPVKDGFDEIKNHLLINSNTAIGKKLIRKLEAHPQIVKFETPYTVDENGIDVESISVNDSARLAFHRLGDKYNRKFKNKYTR